jgi:peptidyl-tRNA hydrolase, PTH1 family
VLWHRMHRTETEAVTKVIVGLGNPGKSYERNRHNVGFMVLESLAREGSGTWSCDRLSRTCRLGIGNFPVLLVEPLTFMNRSGKAVYGILSRVDRGPGDLVVLLDDLNLPFGRIRIRERGSAGGHHGLESILAAVNTDDVVRVRMGVGEEQMPEDKSGFVLSDFPPERKTDLDAMITKAGNAVKSILSDGVSKTMAIFNA